jgi:phospholipid/cholesterol/gamma-HCH transport system permease protein
VDTLRLEFMPRVIGGMISVLALTAVTSVLALVLAYLAVYGPQTWSFPDFTRVMGKVFDTPVLLGILLKSLAFGLAVTVIPVPRARPRRASCSWRPFRCCAAWCGCSSR